MEPTKYLVRVFGPGSSRDEDAIVTTTIAGRGAAEHMAEDAMVHGWWIRSDGFCKVIAPGRIHEITMERVEE